MSVFLRRTLPAIFALGFFAFSITPIAVRAQQLDMELFEAMQPREIGPAGMSGRVTAIDAIESDPSVIYVGTASGGLWRSTSGGVDWTPIFDEQPAHSIGAIAINRRNPDIIWVGAGEGNPRNSASSGNGVYKSVDGGRTWTHLGLEQSRNIHRIILHPDDPRVALIGVQGPAWGETTQRGVFLTTDAGQTFEKTLYVNERTGVGDMVMDPSNPDHILANMWEFRRWPWFFKSGGEGSGLWESWDGGRTWTGKTHEDGLPEGELGKMGLAFAKNEPEIVYALVEAEKNALYRSTDGGHSFRMINDKDEVTNRPFYYNDIFVDPENENRIYHVASTIRISEDGGRNFEGWQPSYSDTGIHPDHHAFWVSSKDPDFIIEGNDGGMAITRDKGKTWRFVENLPVAQFYHINVDDEIPYNVMGGMQDNGSWVGPAYVWASGGIRNHHWQEVAFGDGFDVSPDPENSRYGYAMSQGGNLSRFDRKTGESSFIKPLHPDGVELRFNWNAAFEQSPHDAATIYYGSQFVHRSTDRGRSWTIISPDLTTDDPEKQKQLESGGLTYDVTQAENFTTITAIGESPAAEGVIWAGTDDGNVQLTRDGGGTWSNVVGRMNGVPEGTWVAQVNPSPHNAAEAVVVFDDHRRNNWEPYVYRTEDYGRSWARIFDGNDGFGYALSYVQDPVEPRLMFVGTEFGLYVSVDEGATWTKWTEGYPTASTMDLAIHPREHDLVIGTFGRSAYVLDDIRPLRALAAHGADLLERPVTVYPAPTAYQAENIQAAGTRFKGDGIYAGQNRPRGAMITYSIHPPEADDEGEDAPDAPDEVMIEIVDGAGEVVRTFDGPAEAGMNRVQWSMTQKGVRFPSRSAPRDDDDEPSGASVLPGMYTVRISYGDHTDSTTVDVQPDPRTEFNRAAQEERLAMYRTYETMIEHATEIMDRIREAREAVDRVNAHLSARDDSTAANLKKTGMAVDDSLAAFQDEYFGETGKQGIYRNPNTVSSIVGRARSYIFSSARPPSTPEQIALGEARTVLGAFVNMVNDYFRTEWAEYRAEVDAAEITLVDPIEPVELE